MTDTVTMPPPQLTLRGITRVGLGWILYSLLLAAYFTYAVPMPFSWALLGQLQGNPVLALLSLPVWFLILRWMDPMSWIWKIVAHALIAPLYTVLGYEMVVFLVQWTQGDPAGQEMRRYGQWTALGFFFMYAVQFAVYHIARSHQRLDWREKQAAALRTLTREQQQAILKAQLNPHFLFNTLNGISAMVTVDPEETRRMISRLSELLRYTIDRVERPLIDLREEIAFTRTYLALEQMRLAHRLRLAIDLDPAALEILVPPMILQPLVENAIKHGIAPAPEGGVLRIQVGLKEERLEVVVQDTGTGKGLNGRSLEVLKTRGMGLKSSDERLRHLFGQEAGLQLQTPAGGGFQVAFSLPRSAMQ